MLHLLQDLADHDLREVGHDQRLDLHAKPSEDIGRILGRDAVQVHEVAQPLVGDAHFLTDPTFPGPKSR